MIVQTQIVLNACTASECVRNNMKINPIMPSGHLWAVADLLPTQLLTQVYELPWQELNHQRLNIGQHRRRAIACDAIPFYNSMDHDFKYSMIKQIEQCCGVVFDNPAAANFNWWVDEPGFRPGMHTDGDLPSAMQIYFYPQYQDDLGTAFFNTPNYDDLLHVFASVPNSGYLMFNSRLHQNDRLRLWHDMLHPVPRDVVRLTLYCWLGPYKKID